MKKRLTERFVQTVAPPAAGRLVFTDAIASGLELRVSVDGRRSWSIRYRPKGGTRQRATYGTYPAKSLAEARARALAIAAAAADGIDLPTKEEAERDEQRRGEGRPRTVRALVDDYLAMHCIITQRRPRLVERLFERHVKPAIGAARTGQPGPLPAHRRLWLGHRAGIPRCQPSGRHQVAPPRNESRSRPLTRRIAGDLDSGRRARGSEPDAGQDLDPHRPAPGRGPLHDLARARPQE